MGEKIKDLEKIILENLEFNIELNEGTKDEKYNIHIQNERINISYKDFNFIKFASCFLVAKKRLEIFKGDKNE